MQLRWHRVEDDRGIRHKVCTIRDVVKSSGMNRAGFVGRDDAGRFWPTFFFAGLLYSIGMQVYFFGAGLVNLSDIFTPLWIGTAVFLFVGFGVPMGLFVRWMGWNSVKHAKRAVLSIGYCPSCAYRLFDIEAESDGCTVCPECGGAWRLLEDTPGHTNASSGALQLES